MKHHVVLRVIAKLLIPYIMLFALYVQFHGEYGPGGGFQAGVLFAVAFILYGLIFGVSNLMRALPPRIVTAGAALGVLIFGGVGLASLALGGVYLDYDVLAHDPVQGQLIGIILIEFGVGLTVASVIVLAFEAFASRMP